MRCLHRRCFGSSEIGTMRRLWVNPGPRDYSKLRRGHNNQQQKHMRRYWNSQIAPSKRVNINMPTHTLVTKTMLPQLSPVEQLWRRHRQFRGRRKNMHICNQDNHAILRLVQFSNGVSMDFTKKHANFQARP